MAEVYEWKKVVDEWREDPEYGKTYDDMFPYGDVASAIVALRLRHNLTQEMLAELLGRRQPYVARLESGRANVSINTLRQLAKATGENLLVAFAEEAATTDHDLASAGGKSARNTALMV